MFQLKTFHLWSKEKISLLPNICGSNHDLLIRTRTPIEIPLPLIQKEGSFLSFNLFILNPFYLLLLFWFPFFPGFFISFRFFFFYPIGIESIENLFFFMNLYYYIPISSRYLPRKIPNWIQNWRVSVSLSMRLCTLEKGINFLKDPGFRALVSCPRSFRWPMLCWRDIYIIRSIA
jgi:hypothetical protein